MTEYLKQNCDTTKNAIPGDYAFGTGQWEDIWGKIIQLTAPAGADNGGITIMNINGTSRIPQNLQLVHLQLITS